MFSSLKRTSLIFLLLAILVAVAVLRERSSGPADEVVRQRILMGTVVEITALGENRQRLAAAVDQAFAEMARLESLMGPAEGSDVVRLSRSADGAEVAPETAAVIALGLRAGELSGGAFDISLRRLKELWGIETERPRVPAAEEIRALLGSTGPGALRLAGRWVTKGDPGVAVDLGGIAKGYAVDRAAEILLRAGVAEGAVNAGGDIRLLGPRRGIPWRIGIQDPRRPEGLLGVLSLQEAAVVTSGDYERFFERDGVRYHHIFDPRTGEPAQGCRSVTVVAKTTAWADALATAAFVLGPEAGLALLEELPEVEGLIVGADGTRHLTAGLQGKMEWR